MGDFSFVLLFTLLTSADPNPNIPLLSYFMFNLIRSLLLFFLFGSTRPCLFLFNCRQNLCVFGFCQLNTSYLFWPTIQSDQLICSQSLFGQICLSQNQKKPCGDPKIQTVPLVAWFRAFELLIKAHLDRSFFVSLFKLV